MISDTHRNPHAEPAKIQLRDLSIRAGQQSLLQKVDATFDAGKVTLVIGPSGVGKTLLLRAIAAIGEDAGVHVNGSIEIGGQRTKPGRIGVVFQDFALFDELSPEGNIRFAIAHAQKYSGEQTSGDDSESNESQNEDSPKESSDVREAEALLNGHDVKSAIGWMQELEIPTGTRLRFLSGGQKQRVAIARALASRPEALLYDEPTSGLDPQTANRVATLIKSTAQAHQQTTVIVTHDYRSLVPIADKVLLLDPKQRTLREIPSERWDSLDQELEQSLAERRTGTTHLPAKRFQRIMTSLPNAVGRFLTGTTHLTIEILFLVLALVPAWKSIRWGPYYLVHYLRLVAGPSAWVYLTVAGGILGFVATYFTFRFLPYASYTEPLLIDDLLGAMGFSLYRILVPILATILIAARCGAAVTSDIGGKRLGRQMEAMQSLRVPHDDTF